MGAAGCGGKGEKLTPNVTSIEDAGVKVDPCNLTATLDIASFGCTPGSTAKCADFEGYPAGSGALPTGWFRYVDKISDAAAIIPDASFDPKPAFLDPVTGLPTTSDTYARMNVGDERCGVRTVAYHLLTQNQAIWGPQIGIKFTGASDGPLSPVNLDTFAGKQWDGIGFWIRKGTDHPELEPTGTTAFVGLSDPHTMSNSIYCNDASNIDSEKCDPYGAGVSFDTKWRYVMLQFDDLRQRGYGVHEDKLDRTKIMQVKFSMDIGDGANGNWNMWIDDIVLYKYK
jgi:hypothetical protein